MDEVEDEVQAMLKTLADGGFAESALADKVRPNEKDKLVYSKCSSLFI
jgi:hypothetical protein